MCDCVDGWVHVINFQEDREYDVPCGRCEKGEKAEQELIELEKNGKVQ